MGLIISDFNFLMGRKKRKKSKTAFFDLKMAILYLSIRVRYRGIF